MHGIRTFMTPPTAKRARHHNVIIVHFDANNMNERTERKISLPSGRVEAQRKQNGAWRSKGSRMGDWFGSLSPRACVGAASLYVRTAESVPDRVDAGPSDSPLLLHVCLQSIHSPSLSLYSPFYLLILLMATKAERARFGRVCG